MSIKVKPFGSAEPVMEVRFAEGHLDLSPNEAQRFMRALHDAGLHNVFQVKYPLISDDWMDFHSYHEGEELWISKLQLNSNAA